MVVFDGDHSWYGGSYLLQLVEADVGCLQLLGVARRMVVTDGVRLLLLFKSCSWRHVHGFLMVVIIDVY